MLDVIDLTPPAGSSVRLHETASRSVARVDGLIGMSGLRGAPWDRPEEDGQVNPHAQYLGAKVITIEGELWGSSIAATFQDWRLLEAAFYGCRSTPGLLTFREFGGLELQADVVFAGGSDPVIQGGSAILAYQVMLRAADPRLYSQVESQSSTTGAPSSSGGIPFPIPFPIPFGSGVVGGSVNVANAGNAPGHPRIQIVGPITSPAVTNTTTGEAIYLDGLVVTSAQTLVIETRPPRYVTVSGVNAAGSIRWADSTYPSLAPGGNVIQFTGGGTSGATTMTVFWRDSYL